MKRQSASREVTLPQTHRRFGCDLQQDGESSRNVSLLLQQVGGGLVVTVLLSDLQRGREEHHFTSTSAGGTAVRWTLLWRKWYLDGLLQSVLLGRLEEEQEVIRIEAAQQLQLMLMEVWFQEQRGC